MDHVERRIRVARGDVQEVITRLDNVWILRENGEDVSDMLESIKYDVQVVETILSAAWMDAMNEKTRKEEENNG